MTLGDWLSCRRLVPGSEVKSEESQRTRAILVARPWSVGIRGDIENQVRSIIGEYGLLFSIALGFQFRKQIIELQIAIISCIRWSIPFFWSTTKSVSSKERLMTKFADRQNRMKPGGAS